MLDMLTTDPGIVNQDLETAPMPQRKERLFPELATGISFTGWLFFCYRC
jgi:hypothetical protein